MEQVTLLAVLLTFLLSGASCVQYGDYGGDYGDNYGDETTTKCYRCAPNEPGCGEPFDETLVLQRCDGAKGCYVQTDTHHDGTVDIRRGCTPDAKQSVTEECSVTETVLRKEKTCYCLSNLCNGAVKDRSSAQRLRSLVTTILASALIRLFYDLSFDM